VTSSQLPNASTVAASHSRRNAGSILTEQRIELHDPGPPPGTGGDRPHGGDDARPDGLAAFARGPRFAAEAAALEKLGTTGAGERLLHALAAMAAVSPRPLTDLDFHRLLDTAVLISRPS
jgi:hypothetical protein